MTSPNHSNRRRRAVAGALLAAALAAGCAEPEGPPDVGERADGVVAGIPRPDAMYPWQVDLNGCQGTLISPGWVMTAAHCLPAFAGVVTHRRTDPITGAVHVQERHTPLLKDITYFIHPQYRLCEGFCTSEHDVMLISVPPFDITPYASPARLPFAPPAAGTVGTLASRVFHGKQNVPGHFSVLEEPIDWIGPGSPYHGIGGFAVVDPDEGVCPGDSGSGFVVNDGGRLTAAGIASAGSADTDGCTEPGQLAIFADVAQHLDFILSVFQGRRDPNTSLNGVPAICRTAPQRITLGSSRRRADVAEIWASGQNPFTKSSFAVHPSSGSSFGVFEEWVRHQGGINPAGIRWAAGDFDGDGDQDLAAAWNDNGLTTITLHRSTGASFVAQDWRKQQGAWAASSEWLPGDFNGDGKADLMEVKKDGSSATFALWRSTGAGFEPPNSVALQQGGWSPVIKWNVADFNLDGRDDILAAWPDGPGTTLTVRLSGANGSLTQSHWLQKHGGWSNDMQFMVGNFDGSGGPDVMVAWNDGGQATLSFYRNDGTGHFSGAEHWAVRNGGWISAARWRAGDFNADGRDEVLAVWDDGGMSTLTVRRWVANGPAGLVNEHWGLRRATWQGSTDWCVGTFDGQ